MNSLNQLAYSVLETVTPKAVIGQPITLDIIKFHIKNVRAQFIRNEGNKNRSIDPEIIQDLGCVDLVLVDRAECCDTEIDCFFLRTRNKLPGFIELHHKPMVTRIGPVDKIARPYQLIPFERVPFEFYNKFTRNEIKAFLMNNNDYMYFAIHKDNILSRSLTKVNIQGILENPSDASFFTSCSGQSCFSDDSTSFPMKGWMASSVIAEVIRMFIGPESKQPLDTSNDNDVNFNPIIEPK